MGEIITTIMSSFSETTSGFTGGIREAFTGLIYETSAGGEQVLSNFAKFGFTLLGFGAAVGCLCSCSSTLVRGTSLSRNR